MNRDKDHFDDVAFGQIFRYYFQDLIRFVCSYVNDEEVAKDIVHDVFWKVLRNRSHLDVSYSMKSYLFTLGRNYALNYLKHLKVVAMNEREVADFFSNMGEQAGANEERLRRVEEKLAELPEKQQMVLVECFVKGRKYKEVAEDMEITVNSLKTHVSRGLKFLRDSLKEDIVVLMMIVRSY